MQQTWCFRRISKIHRTTHQIVLLVHVVTWNRIQQHYTKYYDLRMGLNYPVTSISNVHNNVRTSWRTPNPALKIKCTVPSSWKSALVSTVQLLPCFEINCLTHPKGNHQHFWNKCRAYISSIVITANFSWQCQFFYF